MLAGVYDLLQNNMAQRSTFPRSHLLILGSNSIKSLLPVTPISQAETLLENHQIGDVIQLADEQRKKVQSRLVVDANEVRLISYLFPPLGPVKPLAGRRTRICLSENWLPVSARDALRGRRFLSLSGRPRPSRTHFILPRASRRPPRCESDARCLFRDRRMHAVIRLDRRHQYVPSSFVLYPLPSVSPRFPLLHPHNPNDAPSPSLAANIQSWPT